MSLSGAGFVRWGALFFSFPDAGGVIGWLMALLDIDPVLHALDQAPIGEEDLSPEELWEISQREAELVASSVIGRPHADVQRGLEGALRQAG